LTHFSPLQFHKSDPAGDAGTRTNYLEQQGPNKVDFDWAPGPRTWLPSPSRPSEHTHPTSDLDYLDKHSSCPPRVTYNFQRPWHSSFRKAMSHFDVEVITRAIRSPVRPICRPTLISTPGIASLIAPLSVPTRGGQQYPV